jgi:hypothetical protein
VAQLDNKPPQKHGRRCEFDDAVDSEGNEDKAISGDAGANGDRAFEDHPRKREVLEQQGLADERNTISWALRRGGRFGEMLIASAHGHCSCSQLALGVVGFGVVGGPQGQSAMTAVVTARERASRKKLAVAARTAKTELESKSSVDSLLDGNCGSGWIAFQHRSRSGISRSWS